MGTVPPQAEMLQRTPALWPRVPGLDSSSSVPGGQVMIPVLGSDIHTGVCSVLGSWLWPGPAQAVEIIIVTSGCKTTESALQIN